MKRFPGFMMDGRGLLRAELARNSLAHCMFCDTIIDRGAARVARSVYHTPGSYSRNNGAAEGVRSGGLHEEFMHAQCAFQYDTNPKGKEAACVGGCGRQVAPPDRVVSCFSKPGARCTGQLGKLYYCFTCTAAFVKRHRAVLAGHLGVEQGAANVAWRPAGGPFSRGGGGGGPPQLPFSKVLRERFLHCFRFDPPQRPHEEVQATARHKALQLVIAKALEADRDTRKASLGREPQAANPCSGCAVGSSTALALPALGGDEAEPAAKRLRLGASA